MKKTIFKGSGTAIVTPFSDGKVDFDALSRIIEFQIGEGSDAIIVCGTTGESPTLSEREKHEIFAFCAEKINGRVPMIAGTGSNDTQKAVELSIMAKNEGADAVLVVTPYYNKSSKEGLVKHFTKIADRADLPLILYNVPSRTGVNLTYDIIERLSDHPNICAIKEASGNISQASDILAHCGDKTDVYCGSDELNVPMLAMGGAGIISVLSNVVPREAHRMCSLCFEGHVLAAASLQLRYTELIHALFCDVNPIPVKAALSLMGLCKPEMRLPLCEPDETVKERVRVAMKNVGIIE